ncbi:MAG TPA: hypothetical protein VNU20_09260 [Candidatus Sulfotelmatobacter sp.]|jgi:hypothetical protein|nr:hypothetical protein [Candidatus Sulfotelmatobacter sp.]
MKKLDRLGWAEGMRVYTYGVHAGVRVSTAGMLPQISRLLPPGWKNSRRATMQRLYSLVVAQNGQRAGLRRMHILYADSERIARAAELEQVLAALETDLHRYVAEASPDRTFLHAGVVGWKGRAILLPGRSLSGKTTLVRELLRLGATYYSDEFAVVDDSGRVHPFTRPLGIREDSTYAQTNYTAENLGAASGVKPLPLGAVVICKYKAGARWNPAPLSRGQGALELMANSIAVRNDPRQTLRRIQKLVRSTVFVRGTRGEANESAASILNLLSAGNRQEKE